MRIFAEMDLEVSKTTRIIWIRICFLSALSIRELGSLLTQQSELQITSLLRYLASKDTTRLSIGGVWEQSYSRCLSGIHLSSPTTHLSHAKKFYNGVKPSISQRKLSSVLPLLIFYRDYYAMLITDWELMESMRLKPIPSSRESSGRKFNSRPHPISLKLKLKTNALDLIILRRRSHFTLLMVNRNATKSREKILTSLATPIRKMLKSRKLN